MYLRLSARCRRRVGAGATGIIVGVVVISALAACSGARTPGAAIKLEPFQRLARGADCARDRNSLFLIDDRYVLWAREDMGCADNNYAVTLYERTPEAVLCRAYASVAGPRRSCAAGSDQALFDTAAAHLSTPDLGLGPTHRVRTVPLNGATSHGAAVPASPTTSPSLLTQADCQRAGGVWGQWGITSGPFCQVAVMDADFPCLSGDECYLGHCVTTTGKTPGGCQQFPVQFGCYAEIVKGIVRPALCAD